MDPDNPVKALYIEFQKGCYTDFDLTFDQLLLMFANMILQKKTHASIRFPEIPEKIGIDKLIDTIKERCKEIEKRAGGRLG